MDMERFAIDRVIDANQLDVAAVTQADTFFHWAEQFALAKVDLDRAKALMDLTESDLNLKIRGDPEKYNITKVTEGVIVPTIKIQKEYQDRLDVYLGCKKDVMVLEQAVEAMGQRKRMIEVLVTLHGQQYFAGPSVPRDLAQSYLEHQEKKGVKLNEKQRAKSRRRKS